MDQRTSIEVIPTSTTLSSLGLLPNKGKAFPHDGPCSSQVGLLHWHREDHQGSSLICCLLLGLCAQGTSLLQHNPMGLSLKPAHQVIRRWQASFGKRFPPLGHLPRCLGECQGHSTAQPYISVPCPRAAAAAFQPTRRALGRSWPPLSHSLLGLPWPFLAPNTRQAPAPSMSLLAGHDVGH